jgi:zinc resistance-associated protein
MFKPVVVATAALAMAGSSIVYAQQRFSGPGGEGAQRFEYRHHLSAEDMAAFTDARIAALKAGLQLTAEQAKNWPAFEQALRDMAQLRVQRMQAREAANQATQQGQTTPTTPFDRLAQKADAMSKVSAALKHIADTGAPLFQSLTDVQKHRFDLLARLLRPHHHHMFARNGEGHQGWRQGESYGRDGDGYWRGHQGRQFGQEGAWPRSRMQNLMQDDDKGSDL